MPSSSIRSTVQERRVIELSKIAYCWLYYGNLDACAEAVSRGLMDIIDIDHRCIEWSAERDPELRYGIERRAQYNPPSENCSNASYHLSTISVILNSYGRTSEALVVNNLAEKVEDFGQRTRHFVYRVV